VNTEGQYWVPWYYKLSFFDDKPVLGSFLGINPDTFKINDICYDFCNMMLLTVYFFSYGNPINSKNIKVSFSSTKSLEKALLEYTKMKQKDKFIEKQPEGYEPLDIDAIEDDLSEQAADDSKEYYMGSTYYLN